MLFYLICSEFSPHLENVIKLMSIFSVSYFFKAFEFAAASKTQFPNHTVMERYLKIHMPFQWLWSYCLMSQEACSIP